MQWFHFREFLLKLSSYKGFYLFRTLCWRELSWWLVFLYLLVFMNTTFFLLIYSLNSLLLHFWFDFAYACLPKRYKCYVNCCFQLNYRLWVIVWRKPKYWRRKFGFIDVFKFGITIWLREMKNIRRYHRYKMLCNLQNEWIPREKEWIFIYWFQKIKQTTSEHNAEIVWMNSIEWNWSILWLYALFCIRNANC